MAKSKRYVSAQGELIAGVHIDPWMPFWTDEEAKPEWVEVADSDSPASLPLMPDEVATA